MVVKIPNLREEWMLWDLQQRDRNYKEVPNISYRVEEYNYWTEKTLEEFNRRLHEGEEQISELEDKAIKHTHMEQQKEKRI